MTQEVVDVVLQVVVVELHMQVEVEVTCVRQAVVQDVDDVVEHKVHVHDVQVVVQDVSCVKQPVEQVVPIEMTVETTGWVIDNTVIIEDIDMTVIDALTNVLVSKVVVIIFLVVVDVPVWQVTEVVVIEEVVHVVMEAYVFNDLAVDVWHIVDVAVVTVVVDVTEVDTEDVEVPTRLERIKLSNVILPVLNVNVPEPEP